LADFQTIAHILPSLPSFHSTININTSHLEQPFYLQTG